MRSESPHTRGFLKMTGREYRIALFFTYGTNLAIWKKHGLLSREVKPYLEMQRRGHKVTFYTYGDSAELDFGGELGGLAIRPIYPDHSIFRIRIVAFLYSFLFPFLHVKELRGFDILKSNQMWGAWAPMIAAALTGRSFLVRVGYELLEFTQRRRVSPLKRGLIHALSRAVYQRGNAILCTSRQAKEFIETHFGIPSSRFTVHSNYIDTDLFAPSALNDFNPRILFVGRFDQQKRLTMLMDACHQAKTALDLVGGGELEEELKQYSRTLELDCRFLGVMPNEDLPALMQQYSVFAMTSQIEGNPKALLEAMSCGLCPVGVDVPGIRDIIDGSNGVLVESKADAVAEAIRGMLCDSDAIKPLQRNARKYVEEHCSLQSLVDVEIAVYLECTSSAYATA